MTTPSRPQDYRPEEWWLRVLCQGNPAEVTQLYLPDGVLVGTFAPAPVQGRKEIRRYFDYFIGGKDQLCGEILTRIAQRPSPDVYVVSGVYEFGWQERGRTQTQKARYTFVWRDTRQ